MLSDPLDITCQEGQDGIVLRKPNAAWGGSGLSSDPQAIRYVDEEGEDLFRVTGDGAVGFQALHLAPGEHLEGTYAPQQAFWYQPVVDTIGFVFFNPPTTDPETGNPVSATKDFMQWVDIRSQPARVPLRVTKTMHVVINNTAPADADLNPGEAAFFVDGVNGYVKAKIKKNDGTVVTRQL